MSIGKTYTMANSTTQHIQNKQIYWFFASVLLLSLFGAIGFDFIYLVGLPFGLLLTYLTIINFRFVFYLLLAMIPLSVELVLPGGFGTDLPTEPLMLGLMGVFLIFAVYKGRQLNAAFIRHPVTWLLLLHFGWITITAFTSSEVVVSVKFLLAKFWYIIVFYFLAGYLLKQKKDYIAFVRVVFITLTTTICIIMMRHAMEGFSFREVHFVMGPFYRNHVAYASILVVFLPYLWFAKDWYAKWSTKWWLTLAIFAFYLLAIKMTYTRAAYVCVFAAIGTYFLIRFRLIRWALGGAVVVALVGLLFFVHRNNYLYYAPDYERTISHKKFDNLIEATYKMEDISTMERLYRWVAGAFMVIEKPMFGFGPGTFYFQYRPYTVNSFQTYVSDNPEKSGMHNYYLMVAVEQGIFGLLFFLLLCAYVLIKAEQLYHYFAPGFYKNMVMAAALSFLVICTLQLLNDLIETDKIGPFFFLAMAILVRIDMYRVKQEK